MYKCRHTKKKIFSKIGHYRRFFVVILSMLVLCITVAPTYAYFTTSVKDIETGSGLSTLDIENGKANIHANFDDANWTDSDGNIISEKINPDDNTVIKYGPVWLETGDTNITTKVDLLSEYELTNEIDNDWNNGSKPCEPFEVIVGDIDNFGFGFGASQDVYDDTINTDKHTMDIFPNKYDAKGTDRRMCTSNFYDYYKNYAGSFVEKKGVGGNNDIYYMYGDKYTDGYTQRAAKRLNQDGKITYQGNYMMDGKDWYSLQEAEPITFKYDIDDIVNKDITSVTFQIFTDDIQSAAANKGTMSTFSRSNGNFCVYLIGKDSEGCEFKEKIDEFAQVINDYAQSGPIGNMRTLKLPSKYFYRIKEANGLNNGLKLLIDNEEDGNKIKGDSYAIDFAKMTVNAAASSTSKIKISGHIKGDDGEAIANAMVYAEDGSKAQANHDGYYELITTAGLIRLKAVADGYVDTVKNFDVFYSDSVNLTNKDIEMSLLSGKNKDKYKVTISVKQCDLKGNELSTIGYVESKDVKDNDFKLVQDGTVIQQPIKLSLQPNCKYKLEYELTLNKKDNIDKNNDFTVGFHLNNIKIKGTQENNNGWFSNGTGYDYENGITYKNTNDSNSSGDNNSDDAKVTDTKIYFELPDTKNNNGELWWKKATPSIKLDDEDITNISPINENDSWYVGTTSRETNDSVIQVYEGGEVEENEGLTIHLKVTDGLGAPILHYWNNDSSTETTDWNAKKAATIFEGDGWYKYKINSTDPYLTDDTSIIFNTTIARKGNTSLSRYKIMRQWDENKLAFDIPLNAKEIYYQLDNCTFTETDKENWKYYNSTIGITNSSGRLYFFNTRRIFICTN